MPKSIKKEKVIIIGAGLSGLTAGIYCLDNGFDVEIYEKHFIPGGECTGWNRKGNYIEGCAHWIVGTNPKSDLFPLWKHIGAFDESTLLHHSDCLSLIELPNGEITGFYSDLDKTEKDWLAHFPEDKKQIKRFIKGVKAYSHVRVPVSKPIDCFNIIEYMQFGLQMLPMLFAYLRYKKTSIEDFASKCKNKEFGDLFRKVMRPYYNMHSLLYTMQALYLNDADMIEGGSLKMIRRIADLYKEKGGVLHLSSPVSKVEIEGKKATGIILENGEKAIADYVIISTDAHHAFTKLLDGQKMDGYYAKRFANPKDFPANSGYLLSFAVSKDVSNFPKQIEYDCDFDFMGRHFDSLPLRNFSFDQTLPSAKGKTVLEVLFPASDEDYLSLKKLNEAKYLEAKEELALICKSIIMNKMGLKESEIEILDVATPLTYERYCNAYHGSYMSFVDTAASKGLMRNGKVKGINNLFLSGQWLMPPGGLPIALFTGKNAAYYVSKKAHKRFINRENETPTAKLKGRKSEI